MPKEHTYIAIDLKSFYASVECVERGLDPLSTNLVVADNSRTKKTICLAVSPSLKAYGISGRARLFEVVQRLKEVNFDRQSKADNYRFTGKSINDNELKKNNNLAVDYIAAPPRMAHYIDYSTRIYNIYLKYIAPEDIHVYSIDEVFIDATNYLKTYRMSAHELTMTMVSDVLKQTGITATAGIGPNMYLCKVAMDIDAKHMPADESGVRISELDEISYRRKLWNHRPLTDFWRIGHGIARKLEQNEIYTMGQVARCSIDNEQLLYKLFGVNAELLIDHAWGWEPCTMEMVKKYRPQVNSLSTSQVLQSPYTAQKARIITQEMSDAIALDLVEKRIVSNQMTLTVNYDVESLDNAVIRSRYKGEIVIDYYGRMVPKPAHGTVNFPNHTSSAKQITQALLELYDSIVNPDMLVRRITISTNNVIKESEVVKSSVCSSPEALQLDLFTDYEALSKQKEKDSKTLKKERKMQEALIGIKRKYGKNAILKGLNLEEGATAKERNRQIGGHKA
ncbi:MAG: DNA methylase [Bacteroidales bacterium]|nr:DNA methylase [Bacteroidales bacterium]